MKTDVLTRSELGAWARRLRAERDRAQAELEHVEALLALREKAGASSRPSKQQRVRPETLAVSRQDSQPDETQTLIRAVEAALTQHWQRSAPILLEARRAFPDARMSAVSTALIRLVERGKAEKRGEQRRLEFRKKTTEVTP